jgi:hypothetical protein
MGIRRNALVSTPKRKKNAVSFGIDLKRRRFGRRTISTIHVVVERGKDGVPLPLANKIMERFQLKQGYWGNGRLCAAVGGIQLC